MIYSYKMTRTKSFSPVKLICGIISQEKYLKQGEELLIRFYGPVDFESPLFDFNFTDYYEEQMGKHLKRKFLSFERLIKPEMISQIKIQTNELEEKIKKDLKENFRAVNLDPGYLTSSALFMATAKDFSHRVPLQDGIYAHLELLFTRDGVKTLDWTYPDFKTEGYQEFFMKTRRIYLNQLKEVDIIC